MWPKDNIFFFHKSWFDLLSNQHKIDASWYFNRDVQLSNYLYILHKKKKKKKHSVVIGGGGNDKST